MKRAWCAIAIAAACGGSGDAPIDAAVTDAARIDSGAIEIAGAPRCVDAPRLPDPVTLLDPSTHSVSSANCFGFGPRKFYGVQWPLDRALLLWTDTPRELDARLVLDCTRITELGCAVPEAGSSDPRPDSLYLDDARLNPSAVLAVQATATTRLELASAPIDRSPPAGSCAAPVALADRTVVLEGGTEAPPDSGCLADLRAIELPPRTSLRYFGDVEVQPCCGSQTFNLDRTATTTAVVSGYAGEPYAYERIALPPNLTCADAVAWDGAAQDVALDQPGYLQFETACDHSVGEARWFTVTVPAATTWVVSLDGGADDGTGLALWAVETCGGTCVATTPFGLEPHVELTLANPDATPRTFRLGAAQSGAGIPGNRGVLTAAPAR